MAIDLFTCSLIEHLAKSVGSIENKALPGLTYDRSSQFLDFDSVFAFGKLALSEIDERQDYRAEENGQRRRRD
jgi:hypothetical protein